MQICAFIPLLHCPQTTLYSCFRLVSNAISCFAIILTLFSQSLTCALLFLSSSLRSLGTSMLGCVILLPKIGFRSSRNLVLSPTQCSNCSIVFLNCLGVDDSFCIWNKWPTISDVFPSNFCTGDCFASPCHSFCLLDLFLLRPLWRLESKTPPLLVLPVIALLFGCPPVEPVFPCCPMSVLSGVTILLLDS